MKTSIFATVLIFAFGATNAHAQNERKGEASNQSMFGMLELQTVPKAPSSKLEEIDKGVYTVWCFRSEDGYCNIVKICTEVDSHCFP